MKHLAILTLHFSLLTLHSSAAVPLRWTVETSRAQPATFEAYQGETLAFEAALQSAGKPLELSGIAALYWQTNGMGSAYWETTAAVNSNRLSAVFTPEMDVGAKVYNCFIGVPGTIYHAAFQLRLRPSPGAEPNTLHLPVPVIDFAKVRVLNPPWGSGGGGVDTNAVRDIAREEIVPATNRLNQTLSDALDAHTENTNNPHGVTAAQVGAVPFVTDVNGDKTSVTIGSRKSGESVGPYSLANGYNVTASKSPSHAEGSFTIASGYASHAEGESTIASGNSSHAEGASTTASGNFSHAEGDGTTASGYYSHSEGSNTTASGYYSHAEGAGTTASGDYSHAEGANARTLEDDRYAYAWNGDGDREIKYSSHGQGTFNINPAGGLNGFYIGEQTLYSILTNKADKADISAENPTFSNAVSTVAKTVTPSPSPTLRLFDEVSQCWWIGKMVNGVLNWEVE